MATALRPSTVAPEERVLVLTRRFEAPRALVYAAWTDAARIARWWGPRGFAVQDCNADVRVGGTWRVATRSPEGEEHNASGVYREVAPPERLAFTMAWEGSEDSSPGLRRGRHRHQAHLPAGHLLLARGARRARAWLEQRARGAGRVPGQERVTS
jgi:uncharacterized protein YndB with AHSA1/START domain